MRKKLKLSGYIPQVVIPHPLPQSIDNDKI
jgi:hypothetical protein